MANSLPKPGKKAKKFAWLAYGYKCLDNKH